MFGQVRSELLFVFVASFFSELLRFSGGLIWSGLVSCLSGLTWSGQTRPQKMAGLVSVRHVECVLSHLISCLVLSRVSSSRRMCPVASLRCQSCLGT